MLELSSRVWLLYGAATNKITIFLLHYYITLLVSELSIYYWETLILLYIFLMYFVLQEEFLIYRHYSWSLFQQLASLQSTRNTKRRHAADWIQYWPAHVCQPVSSFHVSQYRLLIQLNFSTYRRTIGQEELRASSWRYYTIIWHFDITGLYYL